MAYFMIVAVVALIVAAFLPNGTGIKYEYDGNVLEQILSGTTVVADNIALHASGAIEEIGYPLISAGSGASYTYELDTYRLDTAIGRANGPQVQNLNFDYDLAGNLTTVTDTLVEFGQTFTYDQLHRISKATSSGLNAYPGPLSSFWHSWGCWPRWRLEGQ